MRRTRKFSLEFKRQVMEELFSGQAGPAQLCRKYDLSESVLYRWKERYARGKLENEPTQEGMLRQRVEQLERLVGKLTLENEFLKRGLQNSLARARRNGDSSRVGDGWRRASGGGAA